MDVSGVQLVTRECAGVEAAGLLGVEWVCSVRSTESENSAGTGGNGWLAGWLLVGWNGMGCNGEAPESQSR